METIDKFVEFDKYCKNCKHKDLPEDREPCHNCLNEPVNQYSHKPVYFEEAANARTK